MEEAEHSRYVSQLKAEFDSCDTTATGFLDREELTALCRKLQLDAHLPLLLATLLGERRYGRVNFEEFKEGFVAVLSRSLDFGTSEDDSSYLEPAVPEEVKPKLVKGAKRYGRRSKPDAALTRDSEDSPPSRAEASDSSPTGIRKAKLRRATSLESVESLKSDEEARSQKETSFQCKGHHQGEEPGGHALMLVCEHLGLQHLHTEEVDVLLRKLDPDLDGRVSIREFKKVLCGSTPITCSTPVRQADLRAPHKPREVSEEHSARSASPSLLMATVGQRVLSRLDDGSGCTSPERVAALWTEEGIGNSRDILQTLDFPLEERLSLADLTLALDNELLVSGNGIHQATLISYKIEIQHLQEVAEQACRERDKVKADLERADRRNLQLVREVDDRHASMETLNQSRIRDLEQDFRDRLTALRSETEQESEALLQHIERERGALQEELQLLRAQEAELQEELCNAVQENGRLEEELNAVKMKLTEAEGSARRLQRDLDQMLSDKFGGLDPSSVGLSHEERFSEIIKEYEQQCRELQDRNDELSSELELLKNQRRNRKCRRRAGATNALSWNQQHSESDSDSDVKHCSSPRVRKKLEPADKAALCSLDDSGPAVSIQTELALEQLKQKHEEELQQLNIQLETQMNYYERSLEKMRQSMEVERKDISQAFKLEISELEEQKSQVEQQVKQLKETVDKLQTQIQHGGGRSNEQERRMQRERAELEQNFAREIGNLVQRLSAEKDQLEAELKLKMDQEVMLVRTQLEEVRSENAALQERLGALQQEVHKMEDEVAKKRRKLEEMEREHERSREEEERLHRENSRYREEVLDLSSRNLQLSTDNAELSTRLRGDQESVRMLHERLATVSKEQEEEHATVRRLQDAALQHEREKLQLQASWTQEKQLLEAELSTSKEKLERQPVLEAELSAVTLKLQWVEEDKAKLLRDADERNTKVEKLQQSVLSLESEAELLRSQLAAISQEKLSHAQDATELQRKLQEAQSRVEELEAGVRKLMREKEELRQALQEQEEQASVTLQEETCKLGVQNQELQHQLSELQVENVKVHKLSEEQKELKSRLSEAEEARIQAQDQAVRADAALSVAQAQHLRQQQEDNSCRDWAEVLQARLMEEQRSRLQLEEELRQQEQKSSSQISTKQDQYEKAMAALQQRAEDVETKLKAVRLLLQEKVEQLKEQLARNAKSSALLKDLYVENSQLMKALQVTEQRQKRAEKKNFLLEEKVGALNKLLRDIVPASLAT
ncbi:ninein-like protein isoform X1 [Pundamilia nyererei]|uniref:Ninein-like protein isoform X1 n=1 Tax=Pundamilia nyererei TaxID=303518 RepID=A0A9Y6MA80_9CICH|nr:PREDICTED: ninein-like protein isoform X1 [Pundamilia nyererei]XP_013768927.1 PREDICTED: ninein-like protein isoform X1 [Pundamilia nyererei]